MDTLSLNILQCCHEDKKKKRMKMLSKLQSLCKDEGFIIIILVFIKITSHSSLLSHKQVGMTVPFSTVFVRLTGEDMCIAFVEYSAN